MKIGDIIKEFRKEHGFSMDVFSELCGLSKSYISMLEANKDSRGNEIAPSVETIAKVAEGMNISFEELFNKLDYNQKVRVNNSVPSVPVIDYGIPETNSVVEVVKRDPQLAYIWKYYKLLAKPEVRDIIESLALCTDEEFEMIYKLADAFWLHHKYEDKRNGST